MTFKQELLGKYVKVIGGFAFKSEHFTEEGVPIVRISDIQGGTVSVDRVARIPEAFIGKGERYAIEPGDVLIAMSGATTGKIGLVPQNVNGLILQNQRVGNFKVITPEKIHKSYLKHFVCSTAYQRQIFSTMAGAAQPNISSKQLENIKIPLPSLPEQRRIAAILDQADALRAKRRKALAQLDSLTQSIFIEMFGDPATNPMKWETRPFKSQIESVRYGTGSPPPYVDSGVPFVRATNIKEGRISTKDLRNISAEDAQKLKKCRVNYGNLIVVRSGVNTGDCAVIPREYDGSCAAFDLIVDIDPDNAVFYGFLINSEYGRRVLEPLTRRAAQPHLNAEQLQSLPLIAPPVKLRKAFAEQVATVDALRVVHLMSLTELDTLFASLQHRAFRGEL